MLVPIDADGLSEMELAPMGWTLVVVRFSGFYFLYFFFLFSDMKSSVLSSLIVIELDVCFTPNLLLKIIELWPLALLIWKVWVFGMDPFSDSDGDGTFQSQTLYILFRSTWVPKTCGPPFPVYGSGS